MTNKRKKLAKAMSQKTGMSHQAAINSLAKSKAASNAAVAGTASADAPPQPAPVGELPPHLVKARFEHGQAATSEFLMDSLVFLVPESNKKIPKWVASGTALSTPTGVVILTAAHNVNNAAMEPIRIGGRRIRETIGDAVDRIAVHPTEDVDVALMFLKPGASKVLERWAIPLSSIATDDDFAVNETDAYVVTGFPSELTKFLAHDKTGKVLDVGIMSVTYGTMLRPPVRDEKGRLCVVWSDIGDYDDRVVGKMPSPNGISGGGLWRQRKVPPGTIWAPSLSAKLVGVPVAWNNVDTEYVVPVTLWRSWLTETLAAPA